MIRFEHTEVFNFEGALRGMRNSWESHEKSDSRLVKIYDEEEGHPLTYIIGPNDLALAMKLSKAGADHGKYLRQIMVSVDITSDKVWWGEADTYKVGTVANSTSTMHTLGKDDTVEVTAYGFDDPDHPLIKRSVEIMKEAVNDWVKAGKKKPSPEWRRMIQLNPSAFLYTRHMTLNYQVLKAWYQARRNHRYEEWHEVAKWIEGLPCSELITLKEHGKA